MTYACPYYGPRYMFAQQPCYPLLFYNTPTYCYATCCCSCNCCCCSKPAPAATPAAPKSGKIQVQGTMKLESTPEDLEKVKESNRRRDREESPREWRRVSSMPRHRAERYSSRDYSDDDYYNRRSNNGRRRRDRDDNSDGRCEGTFVIKGLPKPERREPRRRDEPQRNIDRDCMVKGTLTFNHE